MDSDYRIQGKIFPVTTAIPQFVARETESLDTVHLDSFN